MNEFDLRSFLYKNTLLEKKEDSKKGNKEEQKRMEGAIRDNRDHIKKLKADIEADEKKLAKLKKDYKKDVVKEDLEEMRGGAAAYEEDDIKAEAEEVDVEDNVDVDVDVDQEPVVVQFNPFDILQPLSILASLLTIHDSAKTTLEETGKAGRSENMPIP